MFPNGGMPSPNTQAMFQLGVGNATPGAVDFHRAALRAAAVERQEHQSQQSLPITSQPQGVSSSSIIKTENKSGPFDSQHDNDAANGLFMLAQGNRNTGQPQSQYPVPPQPAAHGHPAPAVQHPDSQYNPMALRNTNRRAGSEGASDQSEESQTRPNTRGRGKRTSGAGAASINGRRKADEPPAKAPGNKKAKMSIGAPSSAGSDMEMDDDDGMDENDSGKPKSKMTDDEKRKNFLERNR